MVWRTRKLIERKYWNVGNGKKCWINGKRDADCRWKNGTKEPWGKYWTEEKKINQIFKRVYYMHNYYWDATT